jgi:SAM-dependent methyltransferase
MSCQETTMTEHAKDEPLRRREARLREWFIRKCDPVRQVVDGLDIGWGGVQRWATARMPSLANGLHLDVACGYATFIAQLGWRYPEARLVGLNIDFQGPHALAGPLLVEAGVRATLVRADAQQTPFADGSFDSASCFLGLQDIEIGFGEAGVRQALAETLRVLRTGGTLTLMDTFSWQRLHALLEGLPAAWIDRAERALDVRWDREVANRAVELYAQGWVAQMRLPAGDRAAREAAYRETLERLLAEVEAQMESQGTYVPFAPVHLAVAQKLETDREGVDSEG